MQISVGRLRRDKGLSVARPTPLGNPVPLSEYGREESIARYREWFEREVRRPGKVRDRFETLLDAARNGPVTLLCWCRTVDQSEPLCHADVVAGALSRVLRAEGARRP
jgi:hypothetical protein